VKSWHRDEQLIEEEGNATELVARQAVEWIKASEAPWFIYVPFQAVHIPIDAPEEYKRLYAGESDDVQRYGGFVSQMDARIGDFVAALDQTGQRTNTLLVFTSDNGGTPRARQRLRGPDPAAEEGGQQQPPPARPQGGTLRGRHPRARLRQLAGAAGPAQGDRARCTSADWMPTLTKLAGWTTEGRSTKFDGLDIWPAAQRRRRGAAHRLHSIGQGGRTAGWRVETD
jgi:arylsulfatase A-like enzyme